MRHKTETGCGIRKVFKVGAGKGAGSVYNAISKAGYWIRRQHAGLQVSRRT